LYGRTGAPKPVLPCSELERGQRRLLLAPRPQLGGTLCPRFHCRRRRGRWLLEEHELAAPSSRRQRARPTVIAAAVAAPAPAAVDQLALDARRLASRENDVSVTWHAM